MTGKSFYSYHLFSTIRRRFIYLKNSQIFYNMKQAIFGLTLLALLVAPNLWGQAVLVDKVIATIGDKIILHSQVEEQFQYLESQQGSLPPEARCELADQLIVQKVFLVQANIDSVVVAPEEVDAQIEARIQQILRYMNNDIEQFKDYYGKTPPEVEEDMRTEMEEQLLVQRMQGQVVADVSVTPAEVKAFFAEVPKDSLPYFSSEVELSEIVIKPKVNDEEAKKAKDKLEDLKERIVNGGEDFAELASIFSDDPGSAARGGSLGWVRRGELVPEFEAAAFRLEPMEYSPIVKTEYGYHFIQLIERRGNTINARHILVKPEITFADKDKAKEQLDSIRTLVVNDSLVFNVAVKKFSEEEQSKSNAGIMVNPQTGVGTFEIGELPSEIYFAIDGLEKGDISEPVEFTSPTGETAYRIVRVLEKTEPHTASLQQDYSKIQNAALEQKKLKYMEEWVDDKVGKMYIQLDDNFQKCPSLTKWTAHMGL